MSDPIVCIECGAMSYNIPGKTPVRCATCWEKLKDRAERAEARNKKLLDELRWYADQTHYLHEGQWKMFSSGDPWKRAQDILNDSDDIDDYTFGAIWDKNETD